MNTQSDNLTPDFDINKFFNILADLYPDADIELDYECDQFALLVESLLEVDKKVHDTHTSSPRLLAQKLLAKYKTPEVMYAVSTDEIATLIHPASTSAANAIVNGCKQLVNDNYNINHALQILNIPDLTNIFQRNLEERALFKLLIATVLSARCTDNAVNKALPRLLADGDSPESLLTLGEEVIAQRINTLGLYKNKAKFIIGICESVITTGCVPRTQEGLEELPGVGRKTANVVLNVALGASAFPVDTHVFRVSNRTGLATGTTPLAVERTLIERVPAKWAKKASQLLILHGRYVCKSQRPQCAKCPLNRICKYYLNAQK